MKLSRQRIEARPSKVSGGLSVLARLSVGSKTVTHTDDTLIGHKNPGAAERTSDGKRHDWSTREHNSVTAQHSVRLRTSDYGHVCATRRHTTN